MRAPGTSPCRALLSLSLHLQLRQPHAQHVRDAQQRRVGRVLLAALDLSVVRPVGSQRRAPPAVWERPSSARRRLIASPNARCQQYAERLFLEGKLVVVVVVHGITRMKQALVVRHPRATDGCQTLV